MNRCEWLVTLRVCFSFNFSPRWRTTGEKQGAEWRAQRQLSKEELQLWVGSRWNGPQDDGGNGTQHTSSTATYPSTSPEWFLGFSIRWSEICLMLNKKLRIHLLPKITLPFPSLHTFPPLKQKALRMQRSTNIKAKHWQGAQKHFRFLTSFFTGKRCLSLNKSPLLLFFLVSLLTDDKKFVF